MEFTRFDDQGNALVVDVGNRTEIKQKAVVRGSIFVNPQYLEEVAQGAITKGNVLGVVRVTGIMGVKRTSEPTPLCHMLNLTELTVGSTIKKENNEVETVCTARTMGEAGVEVRVLTGMSMVLLTVYDMREVVDKSMEVGDIYLEHKSRGKSGELYNPRCARNRG